MVIDHDKQIAKLTSQLRITQDDATYHNSREAYYYDEHSPTILVERQVIHSSIYSQASKGVVPPTRTNVPPPPLDGKGGLFNQMPDSFFSSNFFMMYYFLCII